MREFARLLIYATVGLGMIWLLIELAGREQVSGYALLPLALVLVVVVPLVLGIVMARRERMRASDEAARDRDAGSSRRG
jgi:hypothetical protein